MKRFLSALLLSLVLSAPALQAQTPVRRDTAAFRPQQLIAPGVLMGAGIVIHTAGHEGIDIPVNKWFQEKWRAGGPELGFDNYIQYLPLVMDVGLGMLGARAEHALLDRVIEAALGSACLGIVSWTMKSVINSPRPNGVDNRSFPSGHSDWVFLGAELVRMEYGWGWGAGAYAIATTVAVMRNYNNWHWISDCLMGAGLGILMAHVGRWLLEPTKNLLHIPTIRWDGLGTRTTPALAFAPTVDPYSGIMCASLAFRF